MKIIRDHSEFPDNIHFGLTIGNFDGLHLGHQYLLNNVIGDCQEKDWEPLVLTFSPHPLVVLRGKKHFLISTYEEKLRLLKNLGIKYVYEIKFNRELSVLSPSEFMDSYILPKKNIKGIFLGHDFSFGANKEGNHDFVYRYCQDLPVDVLTLERFKTENKKYSSTAVREMLDQGAVKEILSILGRHYTLRGSVKKGEGRGRTLGFPTANLSVASELKLPHRGVYDTNVYWRGEKYKSVTNIGFNPTFDTSFQVPVVETHILDFHQDLYGETIQVEFLRRVRDEEKFSSVNELKMQINKDVEKRRGCHD